MAKVGHYKLDNEDGIPSNSFPVRPFFKQRKAGAGHWLVARRKLLEHKCRQSRKRESHLAVSGSAELLGSSKVKNTGTILDGHFLMTLHCVDRPSELCSVDISGQKLYSVNLDDLEKFDNVAYINASDNNLILESFSGFPILRGLELSLNGLCNINVSDGDFPHLQMLDLSYNSLSSDDILAIGILPCLKVLHLTGNKLRTLPDITSAPHQESTHMNLVHGRRFCALEVLMLDGNCLSSPGIFVSLANLKRLRHLNLQGNYISKVPYLQQMGDLGVMDFFIKKHSERLAQDRAPSLNSPETPGVKNFSHLKLLQQGHGDSHTDEFQIPFPELQHLNLAANKIADEEALLAVALFPSLSELVIHSNPLTTRRSGLSLNDVSCMLNMSLHGDMLTQWHLPGLRVPHFWSWRASLQQSLQISLLKTSFSLPGDPPILRSILQDRLGIQIQRKKMEIQMKSRIMVSVNPKQKITTKIQKLPKLPLYIEAPNNLSPQAIVSAIEKKIKFWKSALPQDCLRLQSSKHQEDTWESEGTVNGAGCHMLETSDQAPRGPPSVTQDGEMFFMTQVDDELMQPMLLEVNKVMEEQILPVQFRGYETLLDSRPDPDMIQPIGIQQTVRALERALRNLQVYSDGNELPYREKKKVSKPPETNPRLISKDRVEDFLITTKD